MHAHEADPPEAPPPAASAGAAGMPAQDVGELPVSSKAACVLEKLAATEQQRRAEWAKRREDQQEQANPQESVHAFLSQFSSQQSGAEAQLQAVLGPQGPGASSAGSSSGTAEQQLEQLAAVMVQQEQRLAQAAYYLPGFDVRACNAQIQEFKSKLEAARAAALPKKRFAFSSKVARVKGAELPVSSSGNAATAPAAGGLGGIGTGTAGTGQDPIAQAAQQAGPSEQDLALVAAGQGISGLHDQVVQRSAAQLSGHDFVVMDCTGCTVWLLGAMGALRLLRLRGCTVVTGPVPGATFVDDVQDCTLMLASYQVRVHRALRIDMYLRVRSRPIIEHSTGVRVAPYQLQHAEVQGLLQQHNLHEENEMYKCVDDFGWIKAVQSPNWNVLPAEEYKPPSSLPAVQPSQQQGS